MLTYNADVIIYVDNYHSFSVLLNHWDKKHLYLDKPLDIRINLSIKRTRWVPFLELGCGITNLQLLGDCMIISKLFTVVVKIIMLVGIVCFAD